MAASHDAAGSSKLSAGQKWRAAAGANGHSGRSPAGGRAAQHSQCPRPAQNTPAMFAIAALYKERDRVLVDMVRQPKKAA
jgi:hypothetical protein